MDNMTYLSLPLLCDNCNFNIAFNEYIELHPNELKFPFQIHTIYGAFPYMVWNGGVNSNHGENLLYHQLNRFSLNHSIPIRLDCTNQFITEHDFNNIHENTILDIFKFNNLTIEVDSLQLYEYLIKNHKNYKVIFSEEIFEKIICNNCMHCSEKEQNECKYDEQKNQYNFSEKSIYNSYCPNKTKFYEQYDYIEKEISSNNNFSHFKIAPPDLNKINEFNRFLIFNLIKEEYWGKCLNYINSYIGGIV